MLTSEVPTNPHAPMAALFEATIAGLGVPMGREGSAKLVQTGVRPDRVLVGCHADDLPPPVLRQACEALGMPPQYQALLAREHPQASVVLFGLEPGDDEVCTLKVYLEFWCRVRSEVRRTGARTPQLLHLGVKWQTGTAGRHGITRYACHPLLTPAESMSRIVRLMAGCPPALTAVGTGLVGLAARRAPQESFIHLEAEETDTPRRSYDINLYKAGLRLADAMPAVKAAGTLLGIDAAALDAAFGPHAERPLGHISAGLGRDGQPFMTWYWEVEALP